MNRQKSAGLSFAGRLYENGNAMSAQHLIDGLFWACVLKVTRLHLLLRLSNDESTVEASAHGVLCFLSGVSECVSFEQVIVEKSLSNNPKESSDDA
jgi:hypothetical protein